VAIPDFQTLMRPVLVAIQGDEPKSHAQIRDIVVADPQEKFDIIETTLSDGWAVGAALRPVIALQESAKRFPQIKTGEDFTGYE